MYQNGVNLSNIAKELHINKLDVKKVLTEEKIYKETRFVLDNNIQLKEQILKLYRDEFKSINEICEITGCETSPIKRFLKSEGIYLRKANFYNRKYTCNQNSFSFYTPESVYWAGFIAGDGCIYSHGLADKTNNYLSVGLSSIDTDHLEKMKKFIQYTGVLYYGDGRASLTINSPQIIRDLNKLYEISNNKTDCYKPSKNIPKHLEKYFVLGLIDSDGGINKIKRPKAKRGHIKGEYVFNLGFTGTKESCEFIQDFFNNKVKMFPRHNNGTNNFSIIFQGNIQVLNYLNKLYDSHSKKFCLERKYAKYLELAEQYNYSRP